MRVYVPKRKPCHPTTTIDTAYMYRPLVICIGLEKTMYVMITGTRDCVRIKKVAKQNREISSSSTVTPVKSEKPTEAVWSECRLYVSTTRGSHSNTCHHGSAEDTVHFFRKHHRYWEYATVVKWSPKRKRTNI